LLELETLTERVGFVVEGVKVMLECFAFGDLPAPCDADDFKQVPKSHRHVAVTVESLLDCDFKFFENRHGLGLLKLVAGWDRSKPNALAPALAAADSPEII
jgi:hypothetical protein